MLSEDKIIEFHNNTIEKIKKLEKEQDKHEEELIELYRIKDVLDYILEYNPAHYCLGGCLEYLGHRGFCSDECHNNFYD